MSGAAVRTARRTVALLVMLGRRDRRRRFGGWRLDSVEALRRGSGFRGAAFGRQLRSPRRKRWRTSVIHFGGAGVEMRRPGVAVARQRQRQAFQGDALAGGGIPLELHRQGVFLLAAVDGQDAVRRDVADRLAELEVILVIQPLPFGEFLALGGTELAGVPQDGADMPRTSADSAIISARMCCTPASTSSGVVSSFSGLTIAGSTSARLPTAGSPFQIGQGQRLEALLAGGRGQGALLGLVGQIEVFEPLGIVGGEDGGLQLVGQLALVLDALEDGLLAVGELPQQADALLDGAQTSSSRPPVRSLR